MSSQLSLFYEGSTPEIGMKFRTGTSTYLNIDNFLELYVYILDASKNTLVRYSKAGVEVDGNEFNQLIKVDEYNYKFYIESDITKDLGNQELYSEINIIRTNAELSDDKSKETIRFRLINMKETNIDELS